MTDLPIPAAAKSAPLSLFEVYSGYVLTQGQDALENVLMWEKLLRFIAIALSVCVAMIWITAEAAASGEVVAMKAIVSALTVALCAFLLWQARGRAQHEVRIDLIHHELSQVMRGACGLEKQILKVGFDEIESLFIRRNREHPGASALFMRLRSESEPVLLAAGSQAALETVHERMSRDLNKARTLTAAPAPLAPSKPRLEGLQTA